MLKEDVVEVKKEIEELKEMRKNSVRKIKEELTYMNLISLIKLIVVMWAVSIVLVVGAFLIYMDQYDFTTEETNIEQNADTEGSNSPINQNIGGTING